MSIMHAGLLVCARVKLHRRNSIIIKATTHRLLALVAPIIVAILVSIAPFAAAATIFADLAENVDKENKQACSES